MNIMQADEAILNGSWTELIEALADAVKKEAIRASSIWPPFNSVHEGYAVILEELDELWEESKRKVPDKTKLRKEAIHVAAMAIRFAAELTRDAQEVGK